MVLLTLLRRQVPTHKLQTSMPGLKFKDWKHHPSNTIIILATSLGATICAWYVWRMSLMQDVKKTSILNGYDDIPMKPTDQIPVFLPVLSGKTIDVPVAKPVLKE